MDCKEREREERRERRGFGWAVQSDVKEIEHLKDMREVTWSVSGE
jgi:hypothetical protein